MPNNSRKSPRSLKQLEQEQSWVGLLVLAKFFKFLMDSRWRIGKGSKYTHVLLLGTLKDCLEILVLEGINDADG